jgi:hypothetical protein
MSLNKVPVLDASKVDLCKQYLGKEIEVVGRVYAVVDWREKYGPSAPYLNVNFGDFQSEIIKIIIPHSIVDNDAWMGNHPKSWEGQWISVFGKLEERGPKKGSVHPGHLVINLSSEKNLHLLNKNEAEQKLVPPKGIGDVLLKVQVNDTVDYVEISKPEKLLTIQIVNFVSDVSNGQINREAPLAVKLLGKEVGEEFEFNIPTRKMAILRIVKINRLP